MSDPITFGRMSSISVATAAWTIALVAGATLTGAWIFQYVFGLPPCPLCLEQRIPYYVGIPLAAIVAIVAARSPARNVVAAGLGLLAVVFLVSAGLAVYHAGVEWRWWAGPQSCSGEAASLSGTNLLESLQATRIVRCDEAAWRFLGLSLAGWNALISLALVCVALWGIRALTSGTSGYPRAAHS